MLSQDLEESQPICITHPDSLIHAVYQYTNIRIRSGYQYQDTNIRKLFSLLHPQCHGGPLELTSNRQFESFIVGPCDGRADNLVTQRLRALFLSVRRRTMFLFMGPGSATPVRCIPTFLLHTSLKILPALLFVVEGNGRETVEKLR